MAVAPLSPPERDSIPSGTAAVSATPPFSRSPESPSRTPYPTSLTVVAIAAVVISVASLIYFYANGMTNVYGDGVAHVNIARKVVDSPDRSLWQRYIQIGSPWLPLQTVLMLPMVWNDWLWRTGLAGSIVSMMCFVVAAIAVYSIAEPIYSGAGMYQHYRTLPFLAAAVFLFNPGAAYIQSTPMTEMVFMAVLSIAVLALQRWVSQQTTLRLLAASVATGIATLSRYEAWPVAAGAVGLVFLLSEGTLFRRLGRAGSFAGIAIIGPAYWVWHNWAIYGNALEFFNGPNSARGIYLRNSSNLGWSKIFVGHLGLDVLLMLAAVAVCVGPLLVAGAIVGICAIIARRNRFDRSVIPVVLLAIPFGFDLLGLYKGEIQIFPFSAFGLLNVRYGLPSLLLVAILLPAVVVGFGRAGSWAPLAVISLLVAAQYGILISDGPSGMALYQEGLRNGVNSQPARELARAADYLARHPPQAMILMQSGSLGPVVVKGGLRFKEVIHEGTAGWHQIIDNVPADIFTIVIQSDDAVDRKIRSNPALEQDVENNFEEEYRAGSIRILCRSSR
jgi:hypothetical protein